jgi:hypothetical protein
MDDATKELALRLKEWFGSPNDHCPMLMWHDFAQTILNAERARIVGLFDDVDATYWEFSKLSRYQRIIEGLREKK